MLDNVSVKQVEVTNFLGVFVDQHLSWKSHISYVAKKISKTIGIMSKSRFYLSRKSLLSLYYTLVYPYLNYCNIVWTSNYPSNLNRLFLLQKRIVRTTLLSPVAILDVAVQGNSRSVKSSSVPYEEILFVTFAILQ